MHSLSTLLLFATTCPLPSSGLGFQWLIGGSDFGRDWSHLSRSEKADDDNVTVVEFPVPVGVRKMSNDEGEMFFPEYWTYISPSEGQHVQRPMQESTIHEKIRPRQPSSVTFDNVTLLPQLQIPFALHSNLEFSKQPRIRPAPISDLFRSKLKRDFQCVDGTSACTSINRPNSCCATDESCQLIPDSGDGDVGCCPQGGGSCSDEVGNCPDRYESCPGADGGGCCVPGYSCAGVGCELILPLPVTLVRVDIN